MGNNMKTNLFALTPIAASLLLAGCGGYQEVKSTVDDAVAANQRTIDSAKGKFPTRQSDTKPTYVKSSDKPFLAATSVPRDTSNTLPPRFARVTINQPGNYTIPQAAQLISEAVGIPVTLSQDVHLPPQAATAPAGGAGTSPQVQALQSAAMVAQQWPITLGYCDVPLESVLDGVGAAAGGLSWEYNNGRITFFRYITKTFTLGLPTGELSAQINVGVANQMQTGVTGGTSATSTGASSSTFATSFTSSLNAWGDTLSAIKDSILSSQGKVVASRTAGTITVTDGRRQVDHVERFVEDQNKVYSRQVAVHIEVISLDTKELSEFGVNWTAVLSKLNAQGNNVVFSLASPTGITNTNAGAAGVKIVKQINGQSDWSTSQALVSALSTVGRISQRHSFESIALNRRVTPIASIRNTAYIAQTTPATAVAGATTGGIPGLTPGTVSYGFGLIMIPTITTRNALVLDFGVLRSDLIGLVTQTSGTGSNQQSIELPDLVAQQMMQSIYLNTGDTLIISGLEQDTHQYDKRTLNRDGSPGLGGMFSGKAERQSLIVMITPVVANY
jgi:type IVB pilus formation R64 PilN family outer membrane protein